MYIKLLYERCLILCSIYFYLFGIKKLINIYIYMYFLFYKNKSLIFNYFGDIVSYIILKKYNLKKMKYYHLFIYIN